MKTTQQMAITSALLATVAVLLEIAPVQAALIAHYKFDETSGSSAADFTGLSASGVLHQFPTNGSQWVPGMIGGALNFGGPNDVANGGPDYVIAANYPKPTTAMTLTAWVNPRSFVNEASIVKNWGFQPLGQFHFGLDGTSGDLDIFLHTASDDFIHTKETTPLLLNQWQFVAFTANGSKLQLYRNGAAVGPAANYSGNISTSPMSSLGIGLKTDDTGLVPATTFTGYWDGKMDDIGIWNTALSATEINAIYQAGLNGFDLENVVSVPEPSSIVLVAIGMCSILVCAWRRRRRSLPPRTSPVGGAPAAFDALAATDYYQAVD